MQFRDLSKSTRRHIRELAGIAHERELAVELHRLHEQFSRWHAGNLDPHELNAAIHRFHDGSSRRLWNLYTESDLRLAVASAIARGVLKQSEVPPDVAQELGAAIAMLSTDSDDEPESNDDQRPD